ncbi:hypothetical protein [Acinetobacter sp. HY1485]|uniref:hypothetical protein n=1 Tax=Acinetobacter sp. HY1485 TaxID=2970918 RepID=UPI0022B9BBB9|nr:hypothetical protein [Acinetobacter sp. HY1485]
MALNVGENFEQRWLATPERVRQIYLDDLARISDLLNTDTDLKTWQTQEKKYQATFKEDIDQAYQDYKKELLEQARLRERKVLENRLLQKREQQAQAIAEMQQEEQQQFEQENEMLKALAQSLQQNTTEYTPMVLSQIGQQPQTQELSNIVLNQVLENVQVRLELEAENLIDQVQQAIKAFNQNMTQATQEEVELALVQQKAE